MLATSFEWLHGGSCLGVKICPMPDSTFPGPWGDTPWTCTASGDPCTLPFDLNGMSFSACTQQLSDPSDVDQDGSLHNGHPRCQSEVGLSWCGPCSCAAGEEQTYDMSSIYSHTEPVGLITCVPCTVGRFKSLGGSGTSDSCGLCALGTSYLPDATACVQCLPGYFSNYERLECDACPTGFLR